MKEVLNIESVGQNHDGVRGYANLFAQNFASGRREGNFTGISGRIIRGTKPEDFITLTDKPSRRVVFMLDNLGLNNLVGLNGREILENIGYPPNTIDGYLEKGYEFKMVVFPETDVFLGTWKNLLQLVSEEYPQWSDRIQKSKHILRIFPYERVMRWGGEVTEVRKFLADDLNVNELFIGNGTTPNGQREYILRNRRIDSFPIHSIVGFPVK